jgi:allophanate hydrolase subunit 1
MHCLQVQLDEEKLAAHQAQSYVTELQKEVQALKQQTALLRTDKEHAEVCRMQEAEAKAKLQVCSYPCPEYLK